MRLRVQVPEIDFDALRQGKRRALAKAITLIESTNPTHRREAVALLERCLPHSGSSLRIGISGVPCFIFNKEFVINGAQPSNIFQNIINSLKNNDQ